MNLYYIIWVDCIAKIRLVQANQYSWKKYTMIFMSMAMALNFMFLLAIVQRKILGFSFYHLKLDFFPGTKLNSFVSFFILFLLPNILLNYFFIFRNNRYETLLSKYKSHNGKLFISYFLLSIWVPLILLFIGKLIY